MVKNGSYLRVKGDINTRSIMNEYSDIKKDTNISVFDSNI